MTPVGCRDRYNGWGCNTLIYRSRSARSNGVNAIPIRFHKENIVLHRDQKILFILVSSALILRVALFGFGLFNTGTEYFFSFDDALGYLEPAKNLVEGRGYSVDYYGVMYPEVGRTPGYPLLIAASLELSGGFMPLIILQMIIGSFLPILAYYLALRIFENRFAAMAAAVFFAFDPLIIALSTLLMTETIFMALFLGGSILCLKACDTDSTKRWQFIIWGGLALSYATLMRPVLLYTLPVLAIYLIYKLLRRISWQQAMYSGLAFLIALSAFVAPWIVRNEKRAGLAELTSLSSIVAYFYMAPSILSIVEGKTYSEERQALRMRAMATGIKELREPKNMPYFKREAFRIAIEHPKETVLLAGLSLFHLLTHDGYLDTFLQTGLLTHAPQSTAQINALARGEFNKLFEIAKSFLSFPWIIFVMTRLLWIFIAVMAAVGTFYLMIKKPERREKLIFALTVMATIAIATLPVALGIHGRLRIPMDVFLIPLATVGVLYLLEKLSFYRPR